MSRPHYPWYGYINRILDSRTKNTTRKEREAVAAALEAADPDTRQLVQIVLTTRAKDTLGAANDLFMSYSTAKRRLRAFRFDVARRLGLLEE